MQLLFFLGIDILTFSFMQVSEKLQSKERSFNYSEMSPHRCAMRNEGETGTQIQREKSSQAVHINCQPVDV